MSGRELYSVIDGKKQDAALLDELLGDDDQDTTDYADPALFFSPDQPRDPAGTPTGGEWTSEGGNTTPYAVEVRRNPQSLVGTGGKGRVTVLDIAKHLDANTRINNGGRSLDPEKPADMQRAVDTLTAEARFQQSMPGNGGNFYDREVDQVFKLGSEAIPRLETDANLRTITLAMSGIMSPGANPTASMSAALTAIAEYEKTGILPGRNPYPIEEGKDGWLGRGAPTKELQIGMLQHLIDDKGEAGAAEWLLTGHPRTELDALRQASGYAPGSTISGGGKADSLRYGAEVFGPKVGPFILNQAGIGETTVDLWASRTYNRVFGTNVLRGDVPDKTGLVDEPRNIGERALMKEMFRGVATNLGLSEQQTQALLWFHEQALYKALGGRVREATLVDGANKFLEDWRRRAGGATSHSLWLYGDAHDAGFESEVAREAWHQASRARAAEERAAAGIEEFYSPDQPRVPAGSPGGGEWDQGGGNPTKGRMTRERFEKMLKKSRENVDARKVAEGFLRNKYGMGVDFHGVNADYLPGIVSEVDALKSDYPNVDFHNIVAVEMPFEKNTFAMASGGTITLNAEIFGSEGLGDVMVSQTIPPVFAPDLVPAWHDGMGDPRSIITHEFGHLLQASLGDKADQFAGIHFGNLKIGTERSPSAYAGTDSREWFAETFAMTRYGGTTAQSNPQVQAMKTFLEDNAR